MEDHFCRADVVAHFDWAFDKQDESADEIIGDVLQAESDPDAEGSGQDCYGAQVDAGRLEDHDQADGNDDVVDDRADGQSDSPLHAALGEEAGDDPGLEPEGDGEQENNENDQDKERPQGDGRGSGREERDVEPGFDLAEKENDDRDS